MFEMVVLTVTRSKSGQKRVEKRVPENLCLHVHEDTKVECSSPIDSLGLCTAHANSLNYEMSRLPPKKAAEAKAELASRGELLKPYEQGRLRRRATNAYAKLAESV